MHVQNRRASETLTGQADVAFVLEGYMVFLILAAFSYTPEVPILQDFLRAP
jgi:hypothetical protein